LEVTVNIIKHMEKLKKFLKKYWVWILLILLIVLSVLTIILISKSKDEDEVNIQLKSIESPYYILGSDFPINLSDEKTTFRKTEFVMKVSRTHNPLLEDFLKNYISEEIDFNIYDGYNFVENGVSVSFQPTASLLLISRKAGNWFREFPLRTAGDVESFVKEFLDIEVINDVVTERDDGDSEYKGYFEIEKSKFGTITLEGYAYKILVDRSGILKEMEVLLLQNSDITDFQRVPISPLSELVAISRYPKEIHHKTFSDSLHKKGYPIGNISLSRISVTEVQELFLFNTFDTPYIYPTYKLSGDGVIEDYEGDNHRSLTEIYICAINPDYLHERKKIQPDPTGDPYIESTDSASHEPGDEFP